ASGCTGGTYAWSNGGTTSSITVSPTVTTDYTVTCTVSGCTSASSTKATVTVNSIPPTPTVTGGKTICSGESATLTASGCTGTYTWSNGGTTSSITVSPTTTTTYTVTCKISGCTSASSGSGTITVNPIPPVPTVTGGKTICSGESATLTASGCTGTYTWSNGGTTSSITVSPTVTTDYTVTCTVSGCTSASSTKATVTVKDIPSAPGSGNVQGGSICGTGGSSCVTGSPTSPVLNFNVFVEGNTTVKSGDSHGPILTGGDFTINGSYDVSNNYQGTFTAPGDSRPTHLLIGGRVFYTSGGINVNQSGFVKVGDQTGSAVSNSQGNTRVFDVTKNVSTYPLINLQTPQPVNTVFQSGLVDVAGAFTTMRASAVTMSGATNNVTLNFSNGSDKPKITIASGQTNVLNVTGAQLKSYTELNFQNAPTASSPLIINVDISGGAFDWNTTFNQIGSLQNTDGRYILYNFYNATSVNINTGTLIGTIFAPNASVTKTSSSNIEGQVVAKTYEHVAGEEHYQVFSGNVNICTQGTPNNSGSLTLTATCPSGQTPQWYASQASTTLLYSGNSYQVTISQTTTYYVGCKDNTVGCETKPGDRTPVTAIFNTKPEPVATANSPLCAGAKLVLQASGGTNYSWVGPAGSNFTSTLQNPEILNVTEANEGVYTVTVSGSGGCNGTATVAVVINPIPPVPTVTGGKAICLGSSATLTASGCTGTYTWSNGGTTSSITVSPTVTTDYTVTCTVSGCTSASSAKATVTVNSIPPVPTVTGGTAICSGGSATLTASGCTGTYTWSNGGTTSSITVSPTVTTDYTVTCTVSGCTSASSAKATVTVNPIPPVPTVTGGKTICSGESATLTASGCTGTYTWSNGGTTSSITVSPTTTTTYTVTCKISGCTSASSGSGTITVNPIPPVPTVTGGKTICSGESATLTASGCTGTYAWSNGGTTSSITVSPTVTTDYTVTCTVSGCTSASSTKATVT
ncbi:collagen-binding domain-containing protein, partial [Pseudarcicella hirudinis]